MPLSTPPKLKISTLPGVAVYPITIPGFAEACNPSIAQTGDGFFSIVRTVNYSLSDAGEYISRPDRYMSSNWLAAFDRDLNLIDIHPIDDKAFRSGSCEGAFPGGFEDCRLFDWNGERWFSATVVTGYEPLRTGMVLCRLDGTRVVECRAVPSPLDAPMEKNWMPYIDGTALGWIYRADPPQLVAYRNGSPKWIAGIGRPGHLEGC